MKTNIVIQGDCLDVMKQMQNNCIDSIITDPPYGLSAPKNSKSKSSGGFMGKKWDYDVPSIEIFKEMYRVLKPGGTMLCFAGSRTQHRMACNIQDAGFELKDTIMWIYGCLSEDTEIMTTTGWKLFSQIKDTEKILIYDIEDDIYKWEIPECWTAYNVIEDDCYKIKSAKKNGINQIVSKDHRCIIKEGEKLIFKKANELSEKEFIPILNYLNITKDSNILLQQCIISKVKYTGKLFCPTVSTGAFVARSNKEIFITGNSGFPKSLSIGKSINKMQGNQNKSSIWGAYGSALKPAYQPIIIAMKSNDGTYADNALKWGVAGLNIDETRIKAGKEITERISKGGNKNKSNAMNDLKEVIYTGNQGGRFPANVIFECTCEKPIEKEVKSNGHYSHKQAKEGGLYKLGLKDMPDEGNVKSEKSIIHTNPECPCSILDEQSGQLKSGSSNGDANIGEVTKKAITPLRRGKLISRNDSGGASKFFKQVRINKSNIHTDPNCPCSILDEQSGQLKSGDNCIRRKDGYFLEHGGMGKPGDVQTTYGDSGGASRFFYCAKSSKSERNKNCEALEEKQSGGMSGTFDGSLKTGSGNEGDNMNRNNHPTVKPLKLMEYLCNLTKTPTGGIVLDPFAGSGTTGIACKNVGREYILIEKEHQYIEIIKARLKIKG